MKKIIIGFILLLFFSITNGSTEELVLCFGENGHVSVESPHGEFCNKFSPSIHGLKLKKHKNHCVDIALSVGNLYQDIIPSKSLKSVVTAPVFAVVSDQSTLQLNKAASNFLVLPVFTINTSIEYLRTVILLI